MKAPLILVFWLCALTSQAQTMCEALSIENREIRQELINQRTQIEALNVKVQNSAYDLEKARQEVQTLRDLMKGYVHMIDSVNQVNIRLREELDQR